MTARTWTVRLIAAAAADLQDIGDWTTQQFGAAQADRYGTLLADAIRALRAGPSTAGAKARPELGSHLYTLHLGRSGRHFILFRVVDTEDGRQIAVLRVLHDARDIARHVPDDERD